MDYYYALLDNYKLLRQRKFKLSLREEEEEGGGEPTYDEAEAKTAITTAAGGATSHEEAQDTNGVKVWKTEKEEKGEDGAEKVTVSYLGAMARLTATLMADDVLNPNNKDGADEIIAKLIGGKEEDTEQTPTTGVAEKLQTLLDGDEEGKGGLITRDDKGEIATEQEYFPGYDPTKQHSRLQKIVNSVRKKGEGEEQGLGVRGAASQDATVVEKLYNSPDIDEEEALACVTSFSETMEIVNLLKGGDILPDTVTPDQLRELSENIKITPNGVMFNDIYMSYRTGADATNDISVNAVMQLARVIDKHNETCPEIGAGADGTAGDMCRIKPIKPPKEPEGQDINFARRGTLIEHAAVLGDLGLMADMENCEENQAKDAKAKISGDSSRRSGKAKDRTDCEEIKKLADAKIQEIIDDKTTVEQAKAMFANGLCAMGQQCLVDVPSLADVEMTQLAINFLTADPPNGRGWTEEQAVFVLNQISAKGENGIKALAVLVASTRGFDEVYSTLEIVDSTVEGKVGSDLPGQKTDQRKTVTKKSAEEWLKEMEENRSEEEKALDEEAKCAGDGVAGFGSVAQPVPSNVSEADEEADSSNDNVTIGIEIKVRTNIRSGRTKTGEGQSSALSKECNRDPVAEAARDKQLEIDAKTDPDVAKQLERRKMEREFYDANDARLNECTKAHAKKLGTAPWGGTKKNPKTMKQAACEQQKKLDARLKVEHDLMDGKPCVQNGKVVVGAGQAIVDGWLAARKPTEENERKAKAAKDAITALQNGNDPTPEDQKELDKMKDDIEVAETSKMLNENRTDASSPMSAENKAFLLYRMSRDSGSLTECIKDVRGMGTEATEAGEESQESSLGGVEQRMGCINTGVYGMIGGVMSGNMELTGGFRAGKPNASYEVVTKGDEKGKGKKTMGGISFERIKAGGVTAVGKVGMDSLSSTEKVQEAARARKEEKKEATKEREDSGLIVKYLQGQKKLLEVLLSRAK